MNSRPASHDKTIMCAVLTLAGLTWTPIIAQTIEYDTMARDYSASVLAAPGFPENSVFSGFDHNENVSLFSGALTVVHSTGPTLPIDGGARIALSRVYNSKKWHLEVVHINQADYGTNVSYNIGDSWIGHGWTMHLGRISKKAVAITPMLTALTATCSYNRGDYSSRQWFFEDSNGTEYTFAGSGVGTKGIQHAHPNLRIRYFTTGNVNGNNCNPVPGGYQTGCFHTTGSTDYYEVTQPDGTRLKMEKLVDFVIGDAGGPNDVSFIVNYDRAGWYTTEITDVTGNTVYITYAGSQAPYPEAITKIEYTHTDSTPATITMDLWSGTGTVNDGKLKRLKYKAADGSTDVYEDYIYSSGGNLQEVKLPATSGSASLGSVLYEMIAFLTKITYPTGAVSKYVYQPFVAGEYASCPARCGADVTCCRTFETLEDPACFHFVWDSGCPSSCEQDERIFRKEWGVDNRTLFPDGEGAGKPSFKWWWDRFHAHDYLGEHGGITWGQAISKFRITSPDASYTESSFFGWMLNDPYPPDDPRIGLELERKFYSGDGALVRTEQYSHYVDQNDLDCYLAADGDPNNCTAVVVPSSTKTLFEDDKDPSGCFLTTTPTTPAPHQMTQRSELLDSDFFWGADITEGDYLEAGGPRITYRHYFDKWSGGTTACPATPPADNWIKGRFDWAYTEEGAYDSLNRVERNFSFDCSGRQVSSVARTAFEHVKTGWSGSPQAPSSTPNATPSSSDITRADTFDTRGNLLSSGFTGGDPIPWTGSRRAYGATYGTQYGVNNSVVLSGISYTIRSTGVAVDGHAVTTTDANGLQASYSYDALGRLTKATPPGSTEYSTRFVYPDLQHLRTIQSAGTETAWSSTNTDQLYSERVFDGLGRTIEVRKAMPDATVSVKLFRYDQLSRVIFESEWMSASDYVQFTGSCGSGATRCVTALQWSDEDPDGDGTAYVVSIPTLDVDGVGTTYGPVPWGTTTFFGVPDVSDPGDPLVAIGEALGRVRKTVMADGSETLTEYCGPHQKVTVKGVRTSLSGSPTDVPTAYYYDGLGRLALVESPSEGADAEYHYDSIGKLRSANLVSQLPSNPFPAWRTGSISAGQVRSFVHDAAGRLRSSTSPESGTTTTLAYDVWGKPIATQDALGAVRGYHLRHSYDSAGRLTKIEKVTAATTAAAPTANNLLGSDGSFTSSWGSWQRGTMSDNTFTESSSVQWQLGNYGSPVCLVSPGAWAGAYGLVFGSNCSYTAASPGAEAVRHSVDQVTRDDVLSFSYWRQVRQEPSGTLDALSVYVMLDSDGTAVGERHFVFQMDERQASHARWIKLPGVRIGDLFSVDDWPDDGSTKKKVWLYVVFEKGDSNSTGLGQGVMLDEFFLGNRGTETLVENTYDTDPCSGTPQSAACQDGVSGTNSYKWNRTRMLSYTDGALIAKRTSVFKGLNGRLSGESQQVDLDGDGVFDWDGDTTMDEWVTRHQYNPLGLETTWTAPYLPDFESARSYTVTHKRGLLDQIAETGGIAFLNAGGSAAPIEYNAAGAPTVIRYGNGTSTTTQYDAMYRPSAIVSLGAAVNGSAPTLFNPGTYAYDGAGNIASIGSQSFTYDGVGRLTLSRTTEPATFPNVNEPKELVYSYDVYGNMTGTSWTDLTLPSQPPPAGIEFAFDFTCGGNTNRIKSDGTCSSSPHKFGYDANGNITRLTGAAGQQQGALWDTMNRMQVIYGGDPEGGAVPLDRYLYDAEGYRLVRFAEGGDGRPMISIREGAGGLLSEYRWKPGELRPELFRESVHGLGQVLAERTVTIVPVISSNATMQNGTDYDFTLVSGGGASTYTVDMRTSGGANSQQFTGVTLDGSGGFKTAVANLTQDVTNYVRLRREGHPAEGYSAPIAIASDSNFDGTDDNQENQVQAVSVSRVGTEVRIRWRLANTNGRQFKVYFERSDGTPPQDLTPTPLEASVRSLTITTQNEAPPCGRFYLKQVISTGPLMLTPVSIGAYLPPSRTQNLFWAEPGCGATGPGPRPGTQEVFANEFEARDHLGSLRVGTDAAGVLAETHDYYPFGAEQANWAVPSADGMSRMRFTGHEHDLESGAEYMLGRYYQTSLARFMSVDPANSYNGHPTAWNEYAYVRNNPLRRMDPDGRREVEVLLNRFISQSFVLPGAKGDGRTAGSAGSSRTSQRVVVETDAARNGGDPLVGAPEGKAGVSFGVTYRPDKTIPGMGPVGIAVGSGDSLKANVTREANAVVANFTAAESYPLMESVSPPITHDLSVRIREGAGGVLHVDVCGSRSSFPGTEVIVDGQLTYWDNADSLIENALGATTLLFNATESVCSSYTVSPQ